MHVRLVIFTLVFLLVACNKNKHISKKLQRGETWRIEQITINGDEHTYKGVWEITSETDVTEVVAKLFWNIDNEQDAICEWQFQEKAKRFQLNYIQQCEECDGAQLDSLDYFAYALTGSYDVEERKRKSMKFSSLATLGYPNQKVQIDIVRE